MRQHERARRADVIIATAQVPGKPAPRLITKEMVADMKPGSGPPESADDFPPEYIAAINRVGIKLVDLGLATKTVIRDDK